MRWLIAIAAVVAIGVAVASCGGVAFTVANVPAAFGPHSRAANIAFGPGETDRLDVYRPDDAHDRPVVVFWYGGGFTGGARAHYRFVGAALANAGYVAILPDYRVYPAAKFPAFAEDAARALVWARAHAREFGGDPERLYVMGHSAGAWLAASVAYDPRYVAAAGGQRGWIRGVIGLSGPYFLTPNSDVLHTIFAPPWAPADWQPGRFVDWQSPRTLLVHGLADDVVIPAHAEQLTAALRAARVDVEYLEVPGGGHSDTVAALSVPGRRRAPVLAAIQRFIDAEPAVEILPAAAPAQSDPSR